MDKFEEHIADLLTEKSLLKYQMWLVEHENDSSLNQHMEAFFAALEEENECIGDSDTDRSFERACHSLGLHSRKYRIKQILRTAAYCCTAAVAIWLIYAISFLFDGGEVEWKEMVVNEGDTAHLTLSDSSRLTVYGGSRITYPSAFCSDERKVFFDGELTADISSDKENPFVIVSGDVKVEVHGTRFVFSSRQTDGYVELSLIEGSVSLTTGTDVFPRQVQMIPGDIAQYDKKTQDLALSHISPQSIESMEQSRDIRFFNLKMSDIAKNLERHFGVRIVVEDEKIANTRIFAVFSNNETLEEILEAVNSDGKMIVSRIGETICLSSNE